MTQYAENQISLLFLTSDIIHLHAKNPEIKAETKPVSTTPHEMFSVMPAPEASSMRLAPITGISTIRKENLAILSLLFPIINPVAIVAPDLDIPGMVATDWAIPMIRASR